MADSVTWIELIWTGIAVVAIGFTAWIIDDNTRNFAAIRRAVQRGHATTWGPRWWVAVASLVSSVAMFVVWIGFAVIGVVAMTVSPTDSEETRVAVSTATGVVLVCMTLILAGIQVWQVYARTKIRPLTEASKSDIDAAADQTQLAATMVDALRPAETEVRGQADASGGVT